MEERRTMFRSIVLAAVVLAGAAGASLGQTVTTTLTSPQNGQSVAPGATINWTIGFTVSTGDNNGLALLSVDLAQLNPGNPAFLDIPPAANVPAVMANFSRPLGICNVGETNPTTGYTGVQRGTAGRKNLVQIGGAQNTLGQAQPGGSGVAESATVIPAIGQSGSVVLASGSFAAPSTPGVYTFRLQNGIANVLALTSPPTYSAVLPAAVITTGAQITFTVATPCDANTACDANCDSIRNGRDIQAFVNRVLGAGTPCSPCAGDMNASGGADAADISAFVSCLLSQP